ncbi:hypothetical protein B0H21DRAFT_709290 [Amylocystis lapponica]|nr:hypothetical protein B0H21DRAFT_709290 [Amylocystis lapponica]
MTLEPPEHLKLDQIDLYQDRRRPPIQAPCCAQPSCNGKSTGVIPILTTTSNSCSKKRSHPQSDSDSDSDSDTQARRRRKVTSGSGSSKSWAYQKSLRDTEKKNDFVPDLYKLQVFRDKILEDDSHAEFMSKSFRSVRCSACGDWIQMRVLYDTKYWKTHRRSKKCQANRATGLRKTTINQFFKPIGTQAVLRSNIPVPCPGLMRTSDPRVDQYLRRTSTPGGGAPSRPKLAKKIYKSETISWSDLSKKRREVVLREEELQYKWRNSRTTGAVFSTACAKTVHMPTMDTTPVPCAQCMALKSLHTFQVALNRPMPSEENMKYVPKSWRCENLGEIYMKYRGVRKLIDEDQGKSPWLKFGKGVVEGHYDGNTVLLGAIKAMVEKTDRLAKGKSLKNMTYSGIFSDFANCLASVSTRAYLTFRRHFGGPTVRSLQQTRARLPRFQPGISETNLGLACAVLLKLGYRGPLALSWDDTALEPAISVWQQSKDSACAILGSINGVIQVDEGDNLDSVFEQAKLAKAEKASYRLRLFVLTIPLHKVPPIVLAAVARGSDDNAEALAKLHFDLVKLLHHGGIYPVSMAADGTDVERTTQRLIENSASNFLEYAIPNTVPACTINLRIMLFNGRPSVSVQDSMHAVKTGRNQLFTGARILVLGSSPCFFAQLREFAMDRLAPLFHRDVEKVDKQDDRAAARLFSGHALSHHLSIFPRRIGLSIYLFVLGELFDAWQNRHLVHLERAKMVMRARFFLMAWRSHIEKHPDYALHIQFISRESYDIFLTLCDSLISLTIIYRKYYTTYPLLPWLHSTEPCEHIFGVLRQLKKDFSYVDMLYLEPKLRTLLMGAFGDLTAEQQENQTAGGYYHSYFVAKDLDLHALAQWPSDAELQDASAMALQEAEQLMSALGIDAISMLNKYRAPHLSTRKSKVKTSVSSVKGPQTLSDILALYANVTFKAHQDEEKFEACEMALVADSVDQTLKIDALPDSSDQDLPKIQSVIESHRSVERQQLQVTGSAENSWEPPYSLAILNLIDPVTRHLNHDELVRQRTRHQTMFAAKAIRQNLRTQVGASEESPVNSLLSKPGTAPSLRQQILARLKEIVPEVQQSGATSGVDRRVRHAGTYSARSAEEVDTRKQNKETLQSVAASKFVHLRQDAFTSLHHVHENLYNANINTLNPLRNGHFVIVWHPLPRRRELLLGEVKATDAAQSTTGSNLLTVSVYGTFYGTTTYSSIACTELGSTTFLRIPRTHIIFSLASSSNSITAKSVVMPDGQTVEMVTLDSFSAELMKTLQDRKEQISQAVQDLCNLQKKKRTLLSTPEGGGEGEHGGEDSEDDDSDSGFMALQSQWQESDPPEENWDSGNEWPVAGIVNEEEDSFSIKRYEVKWATWNREDGTNTTWERGEHVEELIKKWDTKQSDKRAMFARDSLSMIVRTDPEHLLHQDTTIELAQGLHEKIRAARRRDLAECYSGWDDIEHLTSSDNEDADDHPRHGPAQPRLQRRSSSTVVVQVPVLPKRASTNKKSYSVLTGIREDIPKRRFFCSKWHCPASHQIPGRPTKSLPKHHVKTNSPETGKKAASASISPKYGPPNRRRIHLSERWTQAARRAGAAPVTVVNTVNREDIPPSLDGFEYCERHYVRGSQVPEMDDAASCLVTCDCNVCHNAALCGCQDPSELTDDYGEKELAYTDDGLFKFNLPQGVEVIECNRGCKCNRNTCPNRVAQRPRDVPIEVFRTDACGWGVRATVDLVKGKVMGIHTG